MWQKDIFNHQGSVSHRPRVFLGARDWEWEGRWLRCGQASRSSLTSVAQDVTSDPAEAAPAQDPVSCESSLLSLPLGVAGGGGGDRTAGMSVEAGKGIGGG